MEVEQQRVLRVANQRLLQVGHEWTPAIEARTGSLEALRLGLECAQLRQALVVRLGGASQLAW